MLAMPEVRFWSKVDFDGPGGCWDWVPSRPKQSYGSAWDPFGRRLHRAHRMALTLVGRSLSGGEVMHSCDRKCCVNPAHLKVGTHGQNMRDARDRGLLRGVAGEEHHLARLTATDVQDIRESPASISSLSRRYGVDRATIRAVQRRQTWRHVPDRHAQPATPQQPPSGSEAA